MIRDKDTIYGEPNDPNAITATDDLTVNTLIVGSGNKGIKSYKIENFTGNALIYIDENYEVQYLPITFANKILGTDENAKLTWLDIPDSLLAK